MPKQFDLFLSISQSKIVMGDVFGDWDWDRNPVALLLTYAYRHSPPWVHHQNSTAPISPEAFLRPRRTMIDSGAFTAWNSGNDPSVESYIEFLRAEFENNPERWDEIVGLDKVGDAPFTLRNCRKMREALHCEPMPVFHIGEDFKWLRKYCEEFKKVGLSCRFGESVKESNRFYDECFRQCWPFAFHSFGWANERVLSTWPFQSADSSSFITSGPRYGNYKAFKTKRSTGGVKLGGRIGYTAVKGEVLHALKLERKIRSMWAKELAKLK